MKVLLQPGLYDDFVAGALWLLLRLEGRCMGPKEAAERLQRMGLGVGRGRVNRVFMEYTGRLFTRTRRGSRVLYCAAERV